MAWRLNIRGSVARARQITTVSEFVKRQIVEYFDLSPERVIVAPDAVDPVFSPWRAADAPALARGLGIQGRYIVALGGAPRRGLPDAIAAWRLARQQLTPVSGGGGDSTGLALVVLGAPDVTEEPGLVSPGFLDDERWAILLAGAQALCYPTRYEGFGLPALEAAASGVPVVCARAGALPEVLGDAACWVTSPTASELAGALMRLLTDSAWQRERRQAVLARARAAASWPEVANALLEAYRRSAV